MNELIELGKEIWGLREVLSVIVDKKDKVKREILKNISYKILKKYNLSISFEEIEAKVKTIQMFREHDIEIKENKFFNEYEVVICNYYIATVIEKMKLKEYITFIKN